MIIKKTGKYIKTDNENGFKTVLSQLGASIVEISLDGVVLTMTPVNNNDLNRKDIYCGKTIGPIANRIKDGKITVNEKEYSFPLNENGVCNHSGDRGLSNQMFDVSTSKNAVTFVYKEELFDGIVTYKVIYSFTSKPHVKVSYEVTTTNVAAISLTNHSFFTLGEPSIRQLSLKIQANKFIETDKDTLLPLSIKPIIDCLDFNEEKALIKNITNPYLANHRSKGYDHCLILNNKKEIILKSPSYSLEIKSDFPCVQIYSDNYIDDVITKGSLCSIRRAIAIEPEDNLLEKSIIDKNEKYQRYIVYKFKKI